MLNKFHRLGYTESYTETQNYKYYFLNSRSRDDVPDTSGTLDTIVEKTDEQINDGVDVDAALDAALDAVRDAALDDVLDAALDDAHDAVLDAALEDQSLITAKVPASESNDQVLFMEAGETNNAVTQFVGDNTDFNIVSIYGNTPFHSMGWIKIYPSLQGRVVFTG